MSRHFYKPIPIFSAPFSYIWMFLQLLRPQYVNNAPHASNSSVVHDFFQLRVNSDDLFVDKSMMILEYLINTDHQVYLITRPRRWGKTINIDMLNRFLRIEVDNRGNPLPEKKRVNRLLFAGGKIPIGAKKKLTKTLKPVKIAEHEPSMRFQGKEPVIFVTYADVNGSTYEEIKNSLIRCVTKLFLEHRYLKNTVKNETEMGYFKSHCEGHLSDENTLKTSIRFLSKLLYEHFNDTKVSILMDDYDKPVANLFAILTAQRETEFGDVRVPEREIFAKVHQSKDFQSTRELFASIRRHCYDGNPFLKRGVHTGVLKLANDYLFGDLLDIRECGMWQMCFSEFYGFSGLEVNVTLFKVELLTRRDEVKLRCGGYNIRGKHMYNPYCVINIARTKMFDDNWANTRDNDTWLVKRMLLYGDVQADLIGLMESKSTKVTLLPGISFRDITRTELYPFLLHVGYLTVVSELSDGVYELKIPNEEMRGICNESIIEWAGINLPANSSNLVLTMYNNLMSSKVDAFKWNLTKYIGGIGNYTLSRNSFANIYSAYVYNVTRRFLSTCSVKYETFDTDGDTDITMISNRRLNDIAFVVSYKMLKRSKYDQTDPIKEMRRLSHAARQLIDHKGYVDEIKLRYPYINGTLKLAIVFYEKTYYLRSYKLKHKKGPIKPEKKRYNKTIPIIL